MPDVQRIARIVKATAIYKAKGAGMNLEEIKDQFEVLKDWDIQVGSGVRLNGDPYAGEAYIVLKKRKALIYPWHSDTPEPPDYVLHEMLHAGLVAASVDTEHGELFVMDLCLLFREKDQRIHELEEALRECCRMFEWCDTRYGQLLKEKE